MVIKSQRGRYSPILALHSFTPTHASPELPYAYILSSFPLFYFNWLPCNGDLLLPHIGEIFYNSQFHCILPFLAFGMLSLCHWPLTNHFSALTIISCFSLHRTFLQQSCLFFLLCISVSTLVWNHNFFIFLDDVDLEHSFLGVLIWFKLKLMKRLKLTVWIMKICVLHCS
jgi:hypothetical protein